MGEEYSFSKNKKLPRKIKGKRGTKSLISESVLTKLWAGKAGGEKDVEMAEIEVWIMGHTEEGL